MPMRISPQARQEHLLNLIPFECVDGYPSTSVLLERMSAYYTGTERARRKCIERDLEVLIDQGQIEVTAQSLKPRHFRRLANDPANDPRVKDYVRALGESMLNKALSSSRYAQVWASMRTPGGQPLLAEKYFREVSDSQRLKPAQIKPEVLQAVLAALIQRQTLRVRYQKPYLDAERLTYTLHPQGLLQRGPILYLYALKDAETTTKMFALHRMVSADLLQERAHDDPEFDLDKRIHDGDADYGRGEKIQLKLLVRGYIHQLLLDCPLSEDQQIVEIDGDDEGGEDEDASEMDGDEGEEEEDTADETLDEESEDEVDDEEEREPFTGQLTATVPGTGQLYRWLLGCGDNIKVREPEYLRKVIASQARSVLALYSDD